MGELFQPTHMLLLFGLILPVGLFVWAVQRISRAIESKNQRRDDGEMRRDG